MYLGLLSACVTGTHIQYDQLSLKKRPATLARGEQNEE
jgi:hypothetical protein